MAARRKVSRKSETVAMVEIECYSCPRGHKLPRHGENGACTPLYCSDDEAALVMEKSKRQILRKKSDDARHATGLAMREIAKTEEADTGEIDAIIDAEFPKGDTRPGAKAARLTALVEKVEALRDAGSAVGHFATRMAMMKAPTGLSGPEAEQWADRKMVEFLPLAAVAVGYNLKFGDSKERIEAARIVLDATGRSKREIAGGTQPLLILNFGGGQVSLPWSQGANAKVVEGKVVDAQKPDGKAAGGQAGPTSGDDGAGS